jgi:hypothetical protein
LHWRRGYKHVAISKLKVVEGDLATAYTVPEKARPSIFF